MIIRLALCLLLIAHLMFNVSMAALNVKDESQVVVQDQQFKLRKDIVDLAEQAKISSDKVNYLLKVQMFKYQCCQMPTLLSTCC